MYQRITNLPPESHALASAELKALGQVWREQRAELAETGAYQEMVKRLQREWAIETGIIERLYVWDRGVTEILISQGIDAALIAHRGGVKRDEAERIAGLIEDQQRIVEGLFSFVQAEQPLTEHFIRNLQAQFTARQDGVDAIAADGSLKKVPLLKGGYKEWPNNPRRPDGIVHEYCPPELVKEEMERLVAWYREAEADTAPEVLSAWLHHRFTHIHPFQDGNGRVARTLASLVFLKAGLFPLVVRDSDRKEYIAALEAADLEDLKGLAGLFTRRQKDSLLTALALEHQAQQARAAEQIIQSAMQILRDRRAPAARAIDAIRSTAGELWSVAVERLKELGREIDDQLKGAGPAGGPAYRAKTTFADATSENRHYFHDQIVEIARTLGYFANLEIYRAWVRLRIQTGGTFELVMSFHGYGRGETGVMAVSAFTSQRVPREEGGTQPVDTRPSSNDWFQFNYAEPAESTKERFRGWLEDAITIGLAEWRRLLGVSG